MSTSSTAISVSLAIGALALGCAGQLGDSQAWKRPCGTSEQLDADRQVCQGEAAGLADPSGSVGVEYAQDLFRECLESRGWQRMPSGTVLKCD